MLLSKKMFTCFYKNEDTMTMAQTTSELRLLTGSLNLGDIFKLRKLT